MWDRIISLSTTVLNGAKIINSILIYKLIFFSCSKETLTVTQILSFIFKMRALGKKGKGHLNPGWLAALRGRCMCKHTLPTCSPHRNSDNSRQVYLSSHIKTSRCTKKWNIKTNVWVLLNNFYNTCNKSGFQSSPEKKYCLTISLRFVQENRACPRVVRRVWLQS